MTGTDPAVEAAQRAWDDTDGFGFNTTRDAMEESAREAIAPIRQILDDYAGDPINAIETIRTHLDGGT